MLEYLESQVFSRVKNRFSTSIKEKFPNLNFTTDNNKTNETPEFPTVYGIMLGGVENSMDLERSKINGVVATFQYEVSDNVSQSNARTVMNEVVRVMKTMRFDVVSTPTHQDYAGVYRMVARFRRTIDEDDVL